jgi:hypothetical protein
MFTSQYGNGIPAIGGGLPRLSFGGEF